MQILSIKVVASLPSINKMRFFTSNRKRKNAYLQWRKIRLKGWLCGFARKHCLCPPFSETIHDGCLTSASSLPVKRIKTLQRRKKKKKALGQVFKRCSRIKKKSSISSWYLNWQPFPATGLPAFKYAAAVANCVVLVEKS